jgi:hypothetical protein
MHQHTEQKREISPEEWLTPPVNYAMNPPQHVLDANAQAANMMNKAKMIFIGQCLSQLAPQEAVGEAELEHLGKPENVGPALFTHVNLSLLTLTIKPIYERLLAKPEDVVQKNKIPARKAADLLEFRYCDRLIGTLSYEYEAGEIRVKAEVIQTTNDTNS